MRQNYSKFENNSYQAESSTHELQLNPSPKQEYNRNHIKTNYTINETQPSTSINKYKHIKDILLQSIPVRYQIKSKTQRIETTFNSDVQVKEILENRHRVKTYKNQQQSISQVNHNCIHQSMELFKRNIKNQSEIHPSNSQLLSDRKSSRKIQPHRAIEAPDTQLRIKKVLKELKEQEIRTHKIKKQRRKVSEQQIESFLGSKQEKDDEDFIGKENDNNYRRHELEAAKQLLTGKVTIIWIFVISGQIDPIDRNRIIKMYNGLSDTSYVVPLCSSASQIKNFLQVQKSLFKIVSDIDNIKQVLKYKTYNKIMQFYIFNNQGQKGISKSLNYKAESRKIKGIFRILSKIIDRAQQQIEHEIHLYKTNKGFKKKGNNSKKFPSFIKLSGEDKTYATLYRANLYGSKNMEKNQLKEHYCNFMGLINEKYGNIQSEKQNIKDYEQLDHFAKQLTINHSRQILKFYVRESFYYQILNSMLRTMKTTQQFGPCIFPFYETYHSIKIFYEIYLKQNNRKIQSQVLYRGTKLRTKDFDNLKIGVFIEMLGFMSTSKNMERAKQFCDKDGYMFIINVPEILLPEKYDKYDHGFVDINKYGLANQQYSMQEQVLFNALNIFKVTKISMVDQIKYIYLEYGTIFDLLGRQKNQMNNDQKDILLNYQYCSHMLQQIQDQGDVYMISNQYQQSKQYYKNKLDGEKDQKRQKYLFKLANVQQQCGELDQASKNMRECLDVLMKNMEISQKEKCIKIFSIHSKNAQICLMQQDYIQAEESIANALTYLPNDDEFELAKKLCERGKIHFKKGQIIQAQKDYKLSEQILSTMKQKIVIRKKQISKRYIISLITLICSSMTKQQIMRQRDDKLKELQGKQKYVENMKEQIYLELVKINKELIQIGYYLQDRTKYQYYIQKGREYLLGLENRRPNDVIQKAKYLVYQARIKQYYQLVQSERLLEEAIQIVQQVQQYNPDVGKYSEILGKLQKRQLQKYVNPRQYLHNSIQLGDKVIEYNKEQHDVVYRECKKNLERAVNVLLYNKNNKDCLQMVHIKNQLGELQYYQNKYQSSQSIINQVKNVRMEGGNCQLARSYLLLSKIGYGRGQLRSSLMSIQQSYKILRAGIVKKEQSKYIKLFDNNVLTIEIKLYRSKIYLKQMENDLSLKDINDIKQVIQNNKNFQYHSILADVYQVRGENLIAKCGEFWVQFQKALKIREKQVGQCNLANAVTYCNYSKYLILAQETNDAQKMLHKALQIFSCFAQEHPITWLVLYCSGLLKERLQLYDDSIFYIQKSLLRIKQKHDSSNITVNKIRLQLAKVLHKSGRIQQSIRQLQELEGDLEDQIRASQIRNKIYDQKDDEKISVKRMLYQQLKLSYKEMNKIDNENVNETIIALDKCEQKINYLKNNFKFQDSFKK